MEIYTFSRTRPSVPKCYDGFFCFLCVITTLKAVCCVLPKLFGLPIVSLNRLSVDCGTTQRRQSGYLVGFCLFIRVIYTMLPPHGHCRNLYFINNCKFLFCVNISLILNSFYNIALFDKTVSLFNLYAIRVG